MREYKGGEFCQEVNCEVRKKWKESSEDVSKLKEECQKRCIKSAYEFHDWLIKNNFKIIKY